MKLAVICMDVVNIIRCDETNAMFYCKIAERTVDRLFLGQSMILNLEKEIFLSENLHIFTNQCICLRIIPPQNCLRDLPCHTGRERNNSLVVFPQELLVHTRLIIISLGIREGYKLNQIAIACFVFGKKNQMIVACAVNLRTFLPHAGCQIDLTANDGMNALCLCLFIKSDCTIHDTMIGHGNSVHTKFFRTPYKFLDPTRTVEQTVLRMDVQMGK